VRFSGSRKGLGHQGWYRAIGPYYDHLYDPRRAANAYPFLHDLFRRRGPVRDVLDVACGTFALDMGLAKRGYRIVGRDLSEAMLATARRKVAGAGVHADLALGDMRNLRLDRTFDAVLCLGTAFNYLASSEDARTALRAFRRYLRPGGLLVLDLTHFDPWIEHPENARAENDYRAPDGTRIAVFTFNDQNLARGVHYARFVTLVQKGNRIDLRVDESPLRIWRKDDLARLLERNGFRAVEWWGGLRLGARYDRRKSPRLVSVSVRA